MCCAAVAVMATFVVAASAAQVVGPTYPIEEPDMLLELKAQAEAMERSGELQRRLREGNRRAEESLRNPRAVDGIGPAVRRRTHYFDPTLAVGQDIVTPDGVVIARRGEKVNPLQQVSWSGVWLFFDGGDARQLAEARRLVSDPSVVVKPVMVGGNFVEVSKKLGRRVYFDQAGLLVRRFGITATPATVRQEGLRLRVDEYPAGG